MRKITIIDDNTSFADTLAHELTRRGYSVLSAHTGATGLALVARQSPRLVFLDLRLPDMNGTDVLAPARARCPEAEVVIMTAYPHLSSALAAIRGRVVDYLCKPFTFEELTPVLERASSPRERQHRITPPQGTDSSRSEIEMIGASETSIALRAMISQLAASGIRAALITGESGTGKELVAGLLHAEGPRREVPSSRSTARRSRETLFESELFGHERGAFTGAVGSRAGCARRRTAARSSSTRSETCRCLPGQAAPLPRRPDLPAGRGHPKGQRRTRRSSRRPIVTSRPWWPTAPSAGICTTGSS